MKTCIYGLSYNNSEYIDRWIDMSYLADYRIVGDVGSTDGTVDILRQKGVIVLDLSIIRPWRFDVARNALLTIIPEDCSVAIACDTNQELHNDWHSIVSTSWIHDTDCIMSRIQPLNESPIWGCKVHSPKKYTWVRHAYEMLQPLSSEQRSIVYDILVRDIAYLSITDTETILLDAISERGMDAELMWRLAAFYSSNQKWDDAVAMHKKCIDTGDSILFKSKSMVYLSGLVQDQCMNWLLRAAAETPWRKEIWIDIAYLHYVNQEWAEAVGAGSRAISLFNDGDSLLQSMTLKSYISDIISLSSWSVGMKEISLKYADMAAKLAPNDQRLQNNLMAIKNGLKNSNFTEKNK